MATIVSTPARRRSATASTPAATYETTNVSMPAARPTPAALREPTSHPGPATGIGSAALVAALLLSTPLGAQDAPAEGAGSEVVGTIEMVVDGEAWLFDVVEGPPTEGFATGYNAQPRGEAMALGASLHGRHHGSETTVNLTVGVWQASMEHMCDPFANQLRASSSGGEGLSGRLRPGEGVSESCPPADDGPGGLSLDITLTSAALDEDTGSLRVEGRFSGPLGRGDDAPRVGEGSFQATLRPFEELMGGG